MGGGTRHGAHAGGTNADFEDSFPRQGTAVGGFNASSGKLKPFAINDAGELVTSSGGGGGGAVTIADGADVAEGSTGDAAWSGSGSGTVVSVLKKIAGGSTSPVTGSAPTFATVGVASAQILAANASRKGLLLVNTSSNFISFGFEGNAAVLNSGLTITPYGVLEMTPAMVSLGAIEAIASGASSNLGIQEFV